MNNIFEILSAADKELVHSSMLKFLIQNEHNFFSGFFGITIREELQLKVELEKAFKVVINDGKDKEIQPLRFDILMYESDPSQPFVIIENKFKATPTVKQLELYDRFLKDKKTIKILMVFSVEQIPTEVLDYCEREKDSWIIRSYFSLNERDSESEKKYGKPLFKYETKPSGDKEYDFLQKQYFCYLKIFQSCINKYIKSPETYLSRKVENDIPIFKVPNFPFKNDSGVPLRFLKGQYLLYLQKLISKELGADYKYGLDISLTKNISGASVAFWYRQHYIGINECTDINIGRWYKHASAESEKLLLEDIENIGNEFKSKLERISEKIGNVFDWKFKKMSVKIKPEKIDGKSVGTFIKFKIKKQWSYNEQDLVDACVIILKAAYETLEKNEFKYPSVNHEKL